MAVTYGCGQSVCSQQTPLRGGSSHQHFPPASGSNSHSFWWPHWSFLTLWPPSLPRQGQSSCWLFCAGTSDDFPLLVPNSAPGSQLETISSASFPLSSSCPGNIWQYVESFVVSTAWLGWGGLESAVGSGLWRPGMLLNPTTHRPPSPQRLFWHKMSVVPKLRNPAQGLPVLPWNLFRTLRNDTLCLPRLYSSPTFFSL